LRLWLDEMISAEVARQLRRLGYDALGVQETENLWARRLEDERQLEVAAHAGRALVSFNISDFVLISREWAEVDRRHFGILLIHHRTCASNNIGGLVRGLTKFLEDHPADDALADQLVFL